MAIFRRGPGESNARVWKNCDFRPIYRFISEMIQYRAIRKVDRNPKLSNGTISNDHACDLAQCSMTRIAQSVSDSWTSCNMSRLASTGLCGTTSADSADDYFQQTTIRCYACTLIQSIHDERDHYQGPTGCADPFDDVDIPRVPCDSACGVSSCSLLCVFVPLSLLGFIENLLCCATSMCLLHLLFLVF